MSIDKLFILEVFMKKRIVGFTISAVAVVVVAVASFVSFKVYNANAGADKVLPQKSTGKSFISTI